MRTVQNILDCKENGENTIDPNAMVIDALKQLISVNLSYLIVNENDEYLDYALLDKNSGNQIKANKIVFHEYESRVGNSPAELLTGDKHQHWLEMLGFDLFKQAA